MSASQPSPACFLCHNSRDKPLVREVCQALRQDHGLAAYIDESKLVGGDDWHRAIQAALAASQVCAIFVGANGWGKYQLKWEAKPALARQRADASFRVIPVPLPGATDAVTARLGDLFRTQQRVDFRDTDLGSAIRTLAAAIRGDNPTPEGPPALTPFRVAFDAQRWELANRRDHGVLYRGSRLREAADLRAARPADFGALAHAFLAASAQAEREELGRRIGAHAAVLANDRATRGLAAQLALEAVARCPSADAHAALQSLRTKLPWPHALLELPSPVTAAAQSPTGPLRIALGCDDGQVGLWDGKALVPAGPAHAAAVGALAFDPDGQWLATAAADGSIAIRDLDRRSLRASLALGDAVETLQIRRAGERLLLLACSGRPGHLGKAAVWTVPDGVVVDGAWSMMIAMGAALDATGQRLLLAWGDRVGLVDTVTGAPLGEARPGSNVVAVAAHPAQSFAAVITFDRRLWTCHIDGAVLKLVQPPLADGISPVSTPRFSPDGRWLAAIGDDLRVRVWETATDPYGELSIMVDAALASAARHAADPRCSPEQRAVAEAAIRRLRIALAAWCDSVDMPPMGYFSVGTARE